MGFQEPWLVCQNGRKGRKKILLAQDGEAYYVIDAYNGLTRKKKEQLVRCAVSEALLRRLEVRFDRILKSSIRGVSIGGYGAGDAVYLYPDSGKRMKFILMVNHQKDHVDDFFEKMERFAAPVDKKLKNWNKESWRREGRDQATFEQCKYVPWALSGLSLVCNIGYARSQNWLWYVCCLLCVAVTVLLTILYPSYFTLMVRAKGEKKDAWELAWPIFIHFLTLICMPALNWLNDWLIPGVAAACGVVAVAVLGLFSEEFRRKKSALWMVFFVAGLCGCFMVGQVNRVFDSSADQTYYLAVEDTYKSGGKSTSYHCCVTLPDGREAELSITRALYDELEAGDSVLVVHRKGALGIEYANAYAVE